MDTRLIGNSDRQSFWTVQMIDPCLMYVNQSFTLKKILSMITKNEVLDK